MGVACELGLVGGWLLCNRLAFGGGWTVLNPLSLACSASLTKRSATVLANNLI